MRIALIIEQFDPARGGREASAAQIADEFARRGHNVTVICQQAGKAVPAAPHAGMQEKELELVQLGRRGWSRASILRHFVQDMHRLLRQRRADFDITHAMLPLPFVDIYQPRGGSVPNLIDAGLRRSGCCRRLIGRLLAALNRRRVLSGILERQVAAARDVWIIPGSRLVAEEFRRCYGRTDNVRVVFNAADVPPPDLPERPVWRAELRAELGVPEEATLLLSVAQNFQLKGVPELLEMLAAWRGRVRSGGPGEAEPPGADIRLLIVGGLSGQRRYFRRAHALGLADAVAFRPATREIFRCYAAADAVVLLSWQDACSRVVLEATRWGIPSLTTRLNGACEVLQDGGGIVVDSPRDEPGILAGFARLADPAIRAPMSQACRAKFDFLSITRHVDELQQLYREVMQKP